MNINFTDFTGYLASFLIVMSFVLKDVKKIRIVNFFGCAFFVIYGILSGNGIWEKMLWPIIIPNIILCGIQLYQLKKLQS